MEISEPLTALSGWDVRSTEFDVERPNFEACLGQMLIAAPVSTKMSKFEVRSRTCGRLSDDGGGFNESRCCATAAIDFATEFSHLICVLGLDWSHEWPVLIEWVNSENS